MKLSTASFRSTLIGMVSYVLQCNFQRDSRADFTRESLDAAPLSRIALLHTKKITLFLPGAIIALSAPIIIIRTFRTGSTAKNFTSLGIGSKETESTSM